MSSTLPVFDAEVPLPVDGLRSTAHIVGANALLSSVLPASRLGERPALAMVTSGVQPVDAIAGGLLQSGGFGMVIVDMGDVQPGPLLRPIEESDAPASCRT